MSESTINIAVGSLSVLVEDSKDYIEFIEKKYIGKHGRYKNRDLTIVFSGKPIDTPTEEILSAFREAYSTYFSNKHERACLDGSIPKVWKIFGAKESMYFYKSLMNARVKIEEYEVVTRMVE